MHTKIHGERYLPVCMRLWWQYMTVLKLVKDSIRSVEEFKMAPERVRIPAFFLTPGYACCIMPVTMERSSEARSETGKWMTEMVETTQVHGLQDLRLRAKDQLHPILHTGYARSKESNEWEGVIRMAG
ncbi:hypothetical protein F5141DRAFT_1011130 [Pisolithus sp. B1]|nr:hypothetical protein F5141DRAFT_1011130 [Pisolithus sp. B1]